MAKEFTAQQKRQIEAAKEEYLAASLEIGVAPYEEVREAVLAVYEVMGWETRELEIFYSHGPATTIRIAQLLNPEHVWGDWNYGQNDLHWIGYYQLGKEFVQPYPDDLGQRLDAVDRLSRLVLWWKAYDTAVVLCARPIELYRNDEGQLHNPNGPAIKWADQFGLYYVDGIEMPDGRYVEDHSLITPDVIDAEANLEVRRQLLNLAGATDYMKRRGGKLVSKDDFGELWQIEKYYEETGEALAMVKVVNSTPNADGTFKDYWIQVPPEMTSAHQAVAWTFGADAKEYQPDLET